MMTAEEFEGKAAAAGLKPLDLVGSESRLGCNPMAEPDGVERAPLAAVVQVRSEAEMAAGIATSQAQSQVMEAASTSGSWFKRLFAGK